jgi:transposase
MKVRRQVQRKWQSLSRRERRIVKAFAKGSPGAVLRGRCKVVLSLVRGSSPAEIARVGQASESQVYRVAKRFVEEGPAGLSDRREDNGETKVSEEYEARLIQVVAASPQDFGYRRPTWTQELLTKVLREQTGVRISRTTMSRLLKRWRVRLGRPKPIVGCPWKKARKTRRLNVIRRLIRRLSTREVVVYVDEVDIHLNPKIGADWMLCGEQKTVLTPGKNEKRYLAGALDAKTGKLVWVEAERKNSDLFILLLWRLTKEYPQARQIHVILDNYRIHDSQRTRCAVAALGGKVELHFLPPYCPDHNRIERVWKDLHDNVTRNHRCKDMPQLMQEVNAYLRQRRRALRHQYAKQKAA